MVEEIKTYSAMLEEVKKEIKGDQFEQFILFIIDGIEQNLKEAKNDQ